MRIDDNKQLAFLFSGQGAQVPGMMEDLYLNNKSAKAVFDTANAVLGRSISDLCFHGSQNELNLTHNTQPCMLAADLAAWAATIDLGFTPSAVAGFSLGEYAALVAAGVISMEDAFRIVQLRADAMQEAVPIGTGAMAAVTKVSPEIVEDLCAKVDGYVIPASFNCPGQIVISGEAASVNKLVDNAKARSIRAVRLPMSIPSHCKLMEPAVKQLESIIALVKFNEAKCPIYMNSDALPTSNPNRIKLNLLNQIQLPVLWMQTLTNIQSSGIDDFIEFGPGGTLSKFVKKTLNSVSTWQINDAESLQQINNYVRSI